MPGFTLLSLLMLSGFQVPGESPRLEASTRIVQLTTRDALRIECGSGRFRACTRFLGARLSAKCVSVNGGWSMRTNARYIGFMFLFDRALIPHELLHVRDLERSVIAHMNELEAMRFGSVEACAAAAASAGSSFESRLQSFAVASNALRG